MWLRAKKRTHKSKHAQLVEIEVDEEPDKQLATHNFYSANIEIIFGSEILNIHEISIGGVSLCTINHQYLCIQ